MTDSRNARRPLFLRFVRLREQLSYSLILPSFGFLATILFCLTGRINADRALTQLKIDFAVPNEAIDAMSGEMHAIFGLIMLSAVLVTLANVVIGVVWSQRVFGPIVPIREHIERLKRGQTDSRVTLRQNDELKEIAAALNELADTMKGRGHDRQ